MNESSGKPSKLKIWIAELRVPFFTAAIVPAILGTAIAWQSEDSFDAILFGLVALGVILAHAATNVINDYFDYKSGTDIYNKNRTPFNGGSPFLVEGVLTPKEVYTAAMLMFGGCAAIGFYLAYATTWLVIPLGIVGIGFGYFYTIPRSGLAAKGIGEVALGLGFGPLIVEGAYLVQTQTLSVPVFLAGVPVGLFIGLVLFINQFPDMEADGTAGKNHWVVRMGLAKAASWYVGIMVAAFALIVALLFLNVYPLYALIALVPLPIALKAIKIVREKCEAVRELVPAQAMTIQIHLITGLLLSAGIIAAGFL
ncbi:MAG: 1,4-dihydroxy-2-naphthoate octaprenyltransferase [Thermoplasmata archaeon]|nr:1,4-dihydroxy-2-naphthoate octaprenyltransferase [Thermoplasmata archaeon]